MSQIIELVQYFLQVIVTDKFHTKIQLFKFFFRHTMRKKLPKTLDQLILCKYLVNVLKFTKYLVNVRKFTKYLVNSYHQRGVKHYVLTN
jgi:hypothetical protein